MCRVAYSISGPAEKKRGPKQAQILWFHQICKTRFIVIVDFLSVPLVICHIMFVLKLFYFNLLTKTVTTHVIEKILRTG